MKVAIFTDTFLPQVNGVARTVARIAGFLRQQDVRCLVFAPDCGSLPPGSGEDVHLSPGFDLPFYPECKIALPAYPQVGALLTAFRPDLVHLMTEFSMGLCGLKCAKDLQLPAVASYTTNFPQYLAYYKLGFLERWAWLFLRWFHNQAALNYCPSQAVQAMLAKKGFRNLTVWGRGVDTDLFSPQKRSEILRGRLAPGKKLLFLYVGRLAPEKDLDVLLDAWEMVKGRLPEAQLVITGDGPLAEDLKRRTGAFQTGAGVVFTGYLQGEELAAAYASSDVFVFPSTTETFGNVVLEAMAAGLPVVAAAAGGVKNLVVDGCNGFVCRPRNAADLAAALLKIAADAPHRQKMARQARHYARERSWENLLKTLLDSYREIAGSAVKLKRAV